MLDSLYGKLAAVLMVLLAMVGVGGVVSTLWTTRHYLEEVDQKLNRSLTLRIKSLDRRVLGLEADLSDSPDSAAASVAASGDEIDRLEQTFRSMEARIVRQMDALKRADQLRRELVANVSHDLRTPLASLRGEAEGYVYVHPGISGIGDLEPANFDWRNPVARITIRRAN